MNVGLIVSSYFIPVCALLFLVALIIINPLFEKNQILYFLAAVTVNLLLIFSTSLDLIFESQRANPGDVYLFRRVTTFMNFSLGPIIPLLLLKIFDSKKFRLYIFLPFVINLICCVISIFNGFIFYINPTNSYARGPLFVIPFATSLFYLVLLIIQPVRNSTHTGKKYEQVFLLIIMALLCICMYLEIEWGFHLLNYSCSALSVVMYYLLLNIQGYSLDPLTGIYNRVKYNKALDKISQKSNCMIAVIDINNFKEINDTLGHDAGDRYLIHFATLLAQYNKNAGSVYRIGGDEFVILSRKLAAEAFVQHVAKIQASILKENISFSYGIAEYIPPADLDETLKLADVRMYENKSQIKMQK